MVLKKGSTGKEVEELQKALGIPVDGDFGPQTEGAVKEYQKQNGLVVDGIVGPNTYAKLISEDKSNSNYLWIFDNGHGGIIGGVYQTAGKRSPVWEDGTILYEGEFNRGVVNRLVKLCKENNIDYVNLVDTQQDVSLREKN